MGSIGSEGGHGRDEVLEFLVGPYAGDTDHPWHRLERGEIAAVDFAVEITASAADAGLNIDLGRLADVLGALEVHDAMVDEVRRRRAEGYRTALVTNNVREGAAAWRALLPLDELFDAVIDSSEVGMRKPNPAIYLHTLEVLGAVDPQRAVFLDDIQGNVDGALRAGLHAILVETPEQAIADLASILGDGVS
jgi:epoxide hydrolase-like predicted phosphatase